jgi:hypothetical protein
MFLLLERLQSLQELDHPVAMSAKLVLVVHLPDFRLGRRTEGFGERLATLHPSSNTGR